jgi:DNA (cytosine-5)-methyltransferase 1
MSAPTVISTFSGPGGSSIGYERAGCDVRVALDCAPGKFNSKILQTYTANHPDTTLIPQDARETSAEELLAPAGLERGELDILDGSPPCSPFSNANNQKAWGDHESGTLFDEYIRFVDVVSPRSFVAETVPDLRHGKTTGYFKSLCRSLRSAGRGYNLRTQEIDAAYLGAAHHRKRLIFLGVRDDVGQPPKIRPTTQPTTVREAWEGLTQSEERISTIQRKSEQSDWYNQFSKLPPDAQTRTDEVRTDGKSSGFTQYRLSYRKPSRTPTATRKDLIHPSEDRYLTLPEMKRIIGLPDDYEVPNWECAIRCLPPVLMETIGENLRRGPLS